MNGIVRSGPSLPIAIGEGRDMDQPRPTGQASERTSARALIMGSIDDEKLFRSIQVSFLARRGVIEIFL